MEIVDDDSLFPHHKRMKILKKSVILLDLTVGILAIRVNKKKLLLKE